MHKTIHLTAQMVVHIDRYFLLFLLSYHLLCPYRECSIVSERIKAKTIITTETSNYLLNNLRDV